MSRMMLFRCAAFLVAGLWAASLVPGEHLAAVPLDARQIMQRVHDEAASRSTQMRATFEVFDREGHSKKKEFLYRRLGSGADSKVLAVFTAPEEIRGVALLSIQQHGLAAQQVIFTPATQRVRGVVAQERSSRFIGTDFSYEDIGEHNLDDFSYRMLNDQETIDGRRTYKIEARPVDASRSQYLYLYYWVAQDAPVIVYAEMYGAPGRATRVLHSSELRRVNGIWGARRTEMSTPADGTRTVLFVEAVKFNLPLDEALFTPEALAKINGAAPR